MTRACEVCAYRKAHGSYPPGVRWHCDDGCHQTGYGSSELHCSGLNGTGCHRTFGSEQVFTAHQRDDGCRDPLDLETRDGKRRFKAIERSGKLVWVRSDAYSPGDESEPREAPVPGRPPRVAAEVGYVHRRVEVRV